MKKIKCPKCNGQFRMLSAGNTDGATYKVTKPSRKGGGEQLKKVVEGSKYQIRLTCRCKATEKTRTILTIIGRSRAHSMYMLRRWRDREAKIHS